MATNNDKGDSIANIEATPRGGDRMTDCHGCFSELTVNRLKRLRLLVTELNDEYYYIRNQLEQMGPGHENLCFHLADMERETKAQKERLKELGF